MALVVALAGCNVRATGADDGRFRDVLTRLPEGGNFLLFFGDLDAHRAAIGPTVPPDGAPADELIAHGRKLELRGATTWAPTSRFGTDPSLSPLARSSTYAFMSWDGPRVAEDFLDSSTASVLTGDFSDDAFGPLTPDDELGGVRKVRAAGTFLEDDGDHWLTVRDGAVTLAAHRDDVAATLDAQRGTTRSMADVPSVVRLFDELDDLAVLHGVATAPPTSSAVDAVAAGIRVDPQQPGSWQLIVAHHARDDARARQSSVPGSSGIEFATDRLTALAEEFTGTHDTGVAQVTAHGDVAVAVIPVDDPTIWLQESTTMSALLWGDQDLPGLEDVPASEQPTGPPVATRPSEHATTDAGTSQVSLVDLLSIVPADDSCFGVDVGDFNAHWATIDLPTPTTQTSKYDLLEHVRAFESLMPHLPLRVFGDAAGEGDVLLPLARSAAYAADQERHTEVFLGNLRADMFGRLTPDEALGGVDTLTVDGMLGAAGGTGTLSVADGTATFATTPEGMADALAAQHDVMDTLADVPVAVDLVSALDDLDVIHGNAQRRATTRRVDGTAWGLSADPDRPGSWRLHVLYRPRNADALDDLTAAMAERAGDAADEHAAEVIDVAARDGFAVATFQVTEPQRWFGIHTAMDPMMWDDLELDAEC